MVNEPIEETRLFCARQLDEAAAQYERFRERYPDPSQVPRSATGGGARLVPVSDWTSGFVAGSFWYLFEHARDPAWLEAADRWTRALASQQRRTHDHDIGFIINNAFGNGLRITGNHAYAGPIVAAGRSLATRFSPDVGVIRSWDFGPWRYPVIIDNMMNLELLFRAAELGGPPELREIAVVHARATLENHFRSDRSSYHVVDYDAHGGVIARQTNQGLHDESAWARGQAWGLYGFTMIYRESGDARFLEQALSIADYYIGHPRMPADGVPYFDFDVPLRDDVPNHRDASAGAIATSGLLELSGYASGDAARRYREFALSALRALSSPAYRAAPGTNDEFLLLHAVGNYPIDDEVDVGINYADYYYLEALTRGKRL